MGEQEATRLLSFIREQKRHWKRLHKGIMPERKVIEGWIEACDFALDDFDIVLKRM